MSFNVDERDNGDYEDNRGCQDDRVGDTGALACVVGHQQERGHSNGEYK